MPYQPVLAAPLTKRDTSDLLGALLLHQQSGQWSRPAVLITALGLPTHELQHLPQNPHYFPPLFLRAVALAQRTQTHPVLLALGRSQPSCSEAALTRSHHRLGTWCESRPPGLRRTRPGPTSTSWRETAVLLPWTVTGRRLVGWAAADNPSLLLFPGHPTSSTLRTRGQQPIFPSESRATLSPCQN